jgi:signal transduction histidine kinase
VAISTSIAEPAHGGTPVAGAVPSSARTSRNQRAIVAETSRRWPSIACARAARWMRPLTAPKINTVANRTSAASAAGRDSRVLHSCFIRSEAVMSQHLLLASRAPCPTDRQHTPDHHDQQVPDSRPECERSRRRVVHELGNTQPQIGICAVGEPLPRATEHDVLVHRADDGVALTLGLARKVVVCSDIGARECARQLNKLTAAAHRFGRGLEISEVAEGGPPDLRRAIGAFNAMQQQVTREIARRTYTLAAISHDVRTPLTALRIKTELIADDVARRDLIASIAAMERITASALEFLRGEYRTEPLRSVDLGALIESECSDFEAAGARVTFTWDSSIHWVCRPDALACALRNLIDNAVKYAGSAEVALRTGPAFAAISVADHGPGIPENSRAIALEPFERLSLARSSDRGGFGLGLASARAIAEGHGGELVLDANQPTGLIATIRLPMIPRV